MGETFGRQSDPGSKQYRNNVFCSYFADPMRLLSLCNALLGTDCTDPAELKITTLDGVFFDQQKNDISCILRDQFLILAEHQSSINENMPLRCLSYTAELLQRLVFDKRALYRKKRLRFPAPRFFVLYNGRDIEPLKRIMRLSDAFGGDSSALELIVTAYNINYGLGQPLLKKCRYLEEYSILIHLVKQNLAAGLNRDDAIQKAILYCLRHGIMSDYLNDNREVLNMMRLEWDLDDAKAAWREDGYEDGMEKGMEKGESKLGRLMAMLLKAGKGKEAQEAATDKIRRNELYLQYGIN